MNLPGRRFYWVAALLGASQLLSISLLAQAVTNPPAPNLPNATAPRSVLSRPPAPPQPPPAVPLGRCPISFFRELLPMNPVERNLALTNRPPEVRAQILAKVREYESLKPDNRELRLSVTELRWYLWPLMAGPATNRAALLLMVPKQYRELVKDRLQEWDKVPPDVQKELLGIEPTLRYFTETPGTRRRPETADRHQYDAGTPPNAATGHPTMECDVRGAAPEHPDPVQPILRADAGGKGESA